MLKRHRGFTLIELIAILVILGAVAVTVSARFASTDQARLQASRDDLIAALFFAQQAAMARSSAVNNIAAVVTSDSVSVTENGEPILHQGACPLAHQSACPLSFASGVSATPASFSYDKLGRVQTGEQIITLSIGGNSAEVTVDGSGYAYY